jgi:hypothetical protein
VCLELKRAARSAGRSFHYHGEMRRSFLLPFLLAALFISCARKPKVDVVLRNGRLCDGSSSPCTAGGERGRPPHLQPTNYRASAGLLCRGEETLAALVPQRTIQSTGIISVCEPTVPPTEKVSGTASLAATLGTTTLNW